jgi:hypothetical protein
MASSLQRNNLQGGQLQGVEESHKFALQVQRRLQQWVDTPG